MPYIITRVEPNDDNREYAVYAGETECIVWLDSEYKEMQEDLSSLKGNYPNYSFKLYKLQEL